MQPRQLIKPVYGWCHKGMRKTQLWLGIALYVFTGIHVSAAGFRLSFLDDQAVLDDTCQLLKEQGFPSNSVAAFKKLVAEHNQPGNRVDRGRFPPLENGCYHFENFTDFTNRVVCGFSETPGSNSFPQTSLMCFDVVCLLLGGDGGDAPLLEQDFDSKGFVTVQADGTVASADSISFLAAIGVLSPTNFYEALVGRPRTMAETRMGISLRAKRRLPPEVANDPEDLRMIFANHIADVRKDGFHFPTNCCVGLGLVVNPRRHYIWGDHSFICIAKEGRFICLEKNGTKGPFVRVEFDSEKDVAQYMSWDLLLDVTSPSTANYGSAVLISLNERLIGVFAPNFP